MSIGISRNIIWGLSLLSVLFSVACNDPDITVESIILGKKIRNVESYSISEQKGYRSTLKRDSVKFLGCYGVLDLTVDSFYRCYHIYWLATHLDSNLWLTMGDKIRAVVVKDYGSPSFDTLEPLSRHRVGGRPEVRTFIWSVKDTEVFLNLVKADRSIEFGKLISPYDWNRPDN